MAYPLIILGAGASTDYLKADDNIAHRDNNYAKYKSPLMNQLFDDSRFHEILSTHHSIDSFASDVMNAMSRQNANFEDYLTNLKDKIGPVNQEIYPELVSLIFYLSDLFSEVSAKFYYPRNHYKDLLKKIDNYCNGQACFANFNYDLLLERSLNEHSKGKFTYIDLGSYINSSIKIIKIHGACNWRYNPHDVSSKETTAENYYRLRAGEVLNESNKYEIYPTAVDITNINFNPEYNEGLKSFTVKLPALALPLKNKTSNYVCNKTHIRTLEDCIRKTDRILIIGWRGDDRFLLTLLKEELGPKKISTKIVTFNTSPEEIIKKYRGDVPQLMISQEDVYQKGFSNFMKINACEDFFKQSLNT